MENVPSSIFWKRLYRIGSNSALILGVYPEKTIVQKDTCTPMFTAALFTIVKTWKQPKCPLTEEWLKKMWYREFPGGPVVKTLSFHCQGPSSIPGQGTKILQATWCGQKKKKRCGTYIYNGILLSHKKE